MEFRATPGSIDPHQDAKLTWESKGADKLTLAPVDHSWPEVTVTPQGWVNVAPRVTTVYTLTAIGPKGKKVKKVKVRRKQ
jgi:hypothetical protein